MAKLALINREAKRRKTVAKFAARRAAILALINDSRRSDEDRQEAREKLQQLPRNASPVRLRNRCRLTGRPRKGRQGGARDRPQVLRGAAGDRENRARIAPGLAHLQRAR